MTRRHLCTFLFCVELIAFASAQTAASHPEDPTSTDPNRFMRLAAANRLVSLDNSPWHLHATYQQFSDGGAVVHQGEFEIWWGGPKQVKTAYTSAEYSRTNYSIADALFYTGDDGPPPSLPGSVTAWVLYPLPSESKIASETFRQTTPVISDVGLRCYSAIQGGPQSLPEGGVKADVDKTYLNAVTLTYCFEGSLPAIRAIEAVHSNDGSLENRVTFEGIIRIRGRYLAKSIHLTAHGKQRMIITIDEADAGIGLNEATFTPPADAKKIPPPKTDVSAAVMAGMLLSQTAPSYPRSARAAKIQGTVVLSAKINKQGSIEDLKIVSGIPVLAQAAVDAVSTWRYKPYLLKGQPVEVETQISVVFSMGHR